VARKNESELTNELFRITQHAYEGISFQALWWNSLDTLAGERRPAEGERTSRRRNTSRRRDNEQINDSLELWRAVVELGSS
jgi:hypothetical protein